MDDLFIGALIKNTLTGKIETVEEITTSGIVTTGTKNYKLSLEEIEPISLDEDLLVSTLGFSKLRDVEMEKLLRENKDIWFYRLEADDLILIIFQEPFGVKNKWACNFLDTTEKIGWNSIRFNYIHQLQYNLKITIGDNNILGRKLSD